MTKINEYLKTFFMIFIILQFAPSVFKSIKQQWEDHIESKNHVALIHFNAMIMNSASYSKQLQKYFKDSEIKAILLKIDCGGGAAGTTQALAHEIVQLKKEYPKPIVTYSENICTSGAYYIAAMTDYIVTTGTCIIGSIGSKLPTQFKLKQLLLDYKIQAHTISSGSFKDTLDPFTDLTEEQQHMLQQLADDSYHQFASDIAKQRHLSLQHKDSWANGKVFNGNEALKLKLIDAIGNQNTAIEYIKQNILHSDLEIKFVTSTQPSSWRQWFKQYDEENEIQFNLSESFFTALIKTIKQQCLNI